MSRKIRVHFMVSRIETIDMKDQAQIFAKRLVSASQIYIFSMVRGGVVRVSTWKR